MPSATTLAEAIRPLWVGRKSERLTQATPKRTQSLAATFDTPLARKNRHAHDCRANGMAARGRWRVHGHHGGLGWHLHHHGFGRGQEECRSLLVGHLVEPADQCFHSSVLAERLQASARGIRGTKKAPKSAGYRHVVGNSGFVGGSGYSLECAREERCAHEPGQGTLRHTHDIHRTSGPAPPWRARRWQHATLQARREMHGGDEASCDPSA